MTRQEVTNEIMRLLEVSTEEEKIETLKNALKRIPDQDLWDLMREAAERTLRI
jgi:hypothetical protein